jgi:hypothetical protein
MSDVVSPRYQLHQLGRSNECAKLCQTSLRQLVLALVNAGWREQEVAFHLADAAEDYVMQLAVKPKRRDDPANSNW